MDFLSVAFSFFTTYETLLLPLFTLGITNMIVNSYSLAFGLFSIMMFALFIYLGVAVYSYIAVAGIVMAFILKYVGM
jgi:hypothetical protein